MSEVRARLERAYRADGATGLYSVDELPSAVHEDAVGLTTHFAEAGYLYGLALGQCVGSVTSKGGAR
jgi:hypothetical protein